MKKIKGEREIREKEIKTRERNKTVKERDSGQGSRVNVIFCLVFKGGGGKPSWLEKVCR